MPVKKTGKTHSLFRQSAIREWIEEKKGKIRPESHYTTCALRDLPADIGWLIQLRTAVSRNKVMTATAQPNSIS